MHSGRAAAQRFLHMFGGCTVLWSNMSAEAEVFAVRMTYGAEALYKSAGREPTDYANSKLIIMWGWSPGDGTFGTGTYQYLKRWTFVLVVAGVWIVGAACGLGLYYWWFHSLDKTPPVFVVLIFLMVCTVGGLLAAMVANKPLVAALAIALMSAPLAATGTAAVLHGLYFCDRVSRCLVGLIPY